MLRWPVQLRIHLSNVRKFDRIAFYLRTVFLDKVLSAFRVYQQAGNALPLLTTYRLAHLDHDLICHVFSDRNPRIFDIHDHIATDLRYDRNNASYYKSEIL